MTLMLLSYFFSPTEKLQAGFEFEANKIDVPESMLPRNLNARLQVNLFGYKMNSLEVLLCVCNWTTHNGGSYLKILYETSSL